MHAVEPFPVIARELATLAQMTFDDVERDGFEQPLDPDWDWMYDMFNVGRLVFTTARYRFSAKRPPSLVGYIGNLIFPNVISKKQLLGQMYIFYLHPAYRDDVGFILRWMRANEALLIKLGAKKIVVSAKMRFKDGRVARIFERMGYAPIEVMYARMVP